GGRAPRRLGVGRHRGARRHPGVSREDAEGLGLRVIVDAHIDLAWNMANGRDPRLPAAETRKLEAKESQQCMVGLPDMSAGGVVLFFGSIFVMKGVLDGTDHDVDPELVARGKQQVALYQGLEEEGRVRIIRTRSSLEDH